MKRPLLCAAALLLLLSLVLLCAACGEKPENDRPEPPGRTDEAPIQWQEPALEALVREKLGKPEGDVYPSDLDHVSALYILGDSHIFFDQDRNTPTGDAEGIYDLRLQDSEGNILSDGTYAVQGEEYQRGSISSLADLVHFRRLSFLFIYKNDLQDLSALEQRPLLAVSLWDCNIRSVEPLSQMRMTPTLILPSNHIQDLEPLRGATNLERLSFDGSPIGDISPLQSLTQLSFLSLRQTEVSDIGALAKTKLLEHLRLDGAPVTDLSPLAELTHLQELHLAELPVEQKDWETLFAASSWEHLRALSLSRNRITDIRFLEGREELKDLFLDRTQVTDLSPLQTLPRLRTLSLNNLAVDRLDLSALAGLRLRELAVRQDRAALEGLSALEEMTSLKELTITPNVNLTPEDLDRLRAALPNCDIR